jgi:3-dehydroquinate synthase/shikimate kinase/3-dehydroquinate synthase
VGGKNSINLSQGHNLVGTIHQPVVVVSDVQLACARADRAYRPGLAEIAKHALISDEDMRQLVLGAAARLRAGDVDAVKAVVTRSVEIKADIVSRDEREQGDRVYLNYGHTFANALALLGDPETGSDDAVLPLGLMAAAWLAYRQGRVGMDVVEAHRELLSALGLPTTGNIPATHMGEAWARDKKYRRGVRFVVLNGLGRPEGGVTADDATLAQVFDDLRGSTSRPS